VIEEITRRSESTVALLSTSPRKMRSRLFGFDATDQTPKELRRVTPEGTEFELEEMKEYEFKDIEECDLFFFKCPHNYHNLEVDLPRWAEKVSKYIILHDTFEHGRMWEDDRGVGLWEGIKQLLKNKEWYVKGHWSEQWGLTILSRVPEERPAQRIHVWPPDFGPGREMKKLTDAAGVKEKPSCDCERIRTEMDLLGVVGCKIPTNRERLVAAIEKNSQRWGWAEKWKAGIKLTFSGEINPFVIDPNDVYGSLYDEAVRRAEKLEAQEANP
jgi:hypothetical protein